MAGNGGYAGLEAHASALAESAEISVSLRSNARAGAAAAVLDAARDGLPA